MQEDANRIYLCLDRAFATPKWINQFKDTRVHHLVESTYDHCILLISNANSPSKPHKHQFHFKTIWTKREDCREVIKVAWRNGEITNTPEGIALGLQHYFRGGTKLW